MEALKPLALMLTDRLVAALGGRDGIDAYGKGAIVGEAGEHEHGAIWHVSGGYGMRERLGECRAIVPSAMKVGGLGTTLDIPLGHLNAAYVRSRFDVITVACEDGPRAGEVLFALAMARGGRCQSGVTTSGAGSRPRSRPTRPASPICCIWSNSEYGRVAA